MLTYNILEILNPYSVKLLTHPRKTVYLLLSFPLWTVVKASLHLIALAVSVHLSGEARILRYHKESQPYNVFKLLLKRFSQNVHCICLLSLEIFFSTSTQHL